MLSDYYPIVILLVFAVLFAGVVIGLSHMVGRKRITRTKLIPYESGVDPKGSARLRFSVKFYIIAIIFIIFDIELVFMYPWAVLFKRLGLFGFIEMMIFIGILLAGYIYLWRKGALEWS